MAPRQDANAAPQAAVRVFAAAIKALPEFRRARGDEIERQIRQPFHLDTRPAAERMMRHFLALVASSVARADLPVSRLPMLAAAERAQLLSRYST